MSSLIVEIVEIDNVFKHPNADKLDIATVKGWSCIVGKDDFKKGDRVIFIPPDSIVPEAMAEEYKLEYLKKNGRVRTVKLRKSISQGLVLPVPEKLQKLAIGTDVSQALGIVKWEPPIPHYQQKGVRTKRKRNPLFDKYTDIENIKNFTLVFKPGEEVVITEKIHGTNFRAGVLKKDRRGFFGWITKFFTADHEFCFGSHNVQQRWGRKAGWHPGVYEEIAKRYELDKKIEKGVILYGEIYGKNIQDLTYGLENTEVAFFDAKVNGEYLGWEDFIALTTKYNLPRVPLLYRGAFDQSVVEEHTKGKSKLSGLKEGCVIKPVVESNHFRCGRKILKSINADYLVRKSGTETK